MQVIDFKHLYSAQTFSNPVCIAPMLSRDRGAAQLSTKLSTVLVDDFRGPRRDFGRIACMAEVRAEAGPDATP
jgi:hypothetical protein